MPFLTRLSETLGADAVTPAAAVPARHRTDWSGQTPVAPLALVRPRSTAEVAATLRLCNEARVGVVPQGGLTGLAGGAHPLPSAIALSLDRMAAIEPVDTAAGTLTAEAGAILQDAQTAAAEAGYLLGIDIGARGSCRIGGIVSTNAGGTQVIRYGMTRDHVLGLEVVLADGTIVPAMNKLLKNNVGLDTKQLFIGTEGLLGIVTRAVFRLQPRPPFTATALVGLPDDAALIDLLARARRGIGPLLTSFEGMWPSYFDTMARLTGLGSPLERPHRAYAIVEASGFAEGEARERLEACLGDALADGMVEDAVLSTSAKDERALWAVREAVADYDRLMGGPYLPFDVGIPLARMRHAVHRLESEIAARWPDALAMSYGHIGDSNLHLVVRVPSAGDRQPEAEIKALVYGITREMEGSISAEHGIGSTKRDYMAYSRSPAELALMRSVKAALDPNGILNPGRSFGPDA